ncbi:hypothetical protein KABACHOK_00290 [Brevundimonas phage vB_BpoS-Kabachok]|uniref:Uncharacterized protein n=1 Tax=Brevundimonas phage vB_BpoS-Kabachok TaxID=2948600 RepID=A0A9E7MQH6_9CAUD|nr:hypothetical protein KABACHOK_00290 [Brevundimonas phage vB_BpoS-Kabachok]
MPIYRAADYPQKGADDGQAQAAMAAADRIKALERTGVAQFRRRWDPDQEAYIVEPILTPGPDVYACADFASEAVRAGSDARDLARATALERLKALEDASGLEQRLRWSTSLQTYWIEAVPFKAPERPWNMTDNRPPDRRPNWDKKPSQFADFDRMLLDAAPLAPMQWLICNDTPRDGRHINDIRTDLQAALDAQYGRGHFWAYNHGHRISIQCRYPIAAKAESVLVLDEKQNLTREEALKHGLIVE